MSGEDDGVVRSPHRGDEIRMRWTERGSADALDDAIERKMQLVRLMKGNLERARDDLSAAGETLRRRKDDCQVLRFDAAILRDLRYDFCRGSAATFDHKDGIGGRVGVGELLKQRFSSRECASRPRSEREKRVVAVLE